MAEYTDNNGNVIEFLLPILGGGSSTGEIVSEAISSSNRADYVPSVPGLVKLYNASSGLQLVNVTGDEFDAEGNKTGNTVDYGKHLFIAAASVEEIEDMVSLCKPIVPGRLAYAIAASETTADLLQSAALNSDYAQLHSTVVTPATMKAAIAANRAFTGFSSKTDDKIVTPADMQNIIKANKSAVESISQDSTVDWSIITPSVLPAALSKLAAKSIPKTESSTDAKQIPTVDAVRDHVSDRINDIASVKVEIISQGNEFTLPRSTIAAIFPYSASLSGKMYNGSGGFDDHSITLDEIALVYRTDNLYDTTAETRVAVVYGAKGALGVPTLKSYHQLCHGDITIKSISGNTHVYYMSKYG